MIMRKNKLKIAKIRCLLPLLVLIISAGILSFVANYVNMASYKQVRTKAKLNAVTYSDRMVEELNRGINITNSLENILLNDNGNIKQFEDIAQRMMTDYVQSIQLAPNGVVTDIYPSEGNDAGKIDLVHDKIRGEIVRYGIKHQITVIQGPFKLNQGGCGITIRNPVYLQKNDGERYFWGFAIVIIKVPEIFNDSVKSLSKFGYYYRLYKTESPLTKKFKLINSSKTEFTDSVSHEFNIGGCVWKIEVMPVKGWSQESDMLPIYLCGTFIILLLEGVTAAFLIMLKQRKRFKVLSVTDSLTGLFNRMGFNEQLDIYISENGDKNCIGILLDVDNFKIINDMYGHGVGDKALKHLAESMRDAFSDNAILGRNGGDEFCILLKDCNVEDMRQKIEEFCKMNRVFRYKGEEYTYSISMGYAEYPVHVKKASELLHYADIALYEVKLKGKNGCLGYNDNIQSEKRTQLGFKLNDISSNLPGAFFIYKADIDDEEILYANQEMIRLVGCEDLDDFFEFTKRQFKNLIHPDEIQAVEENIWSQIKIAENKTNDYVWYHLATKSGEYKKVFDIGHIVESEHYGKVFYVLLIDYDIVCRHYEKNKNNQLSE